MQTLLMQSESCVTLQNFSRHDRVTVSRLSISYISLSVVCYLSTSSQILTLAKKRKKKRKGQLNTMIVLFCPSVCGRTQLNEHQSLLAD